MPRRLLVLAVAFALLAVPLVPAGAQTTDSSTPEPLAPASLEEPPAEPLVECEAPGPDVTVITLGSAASELEAPLLLDDTTTRRFLLDLSPATATTTASVGITMSWAVVANDFDLAMDVDGVERGISEGWQPADAAEEHVAARLAHCTILEARAINFLALGVPAETLALTLDVSGKR